MHLKDIADIPAQDYNSFRYSAATSATASSEVDLVTNDRSGDTIYRIYAIGPAATTSYEGVWLLFGRESGSVPAVDPAATNGDPDVPTAFVPAGMWVDLKVNRRTRYMRHVSSDSDGRILVVKASE